MPPTTKVHSRMLHESPSAIVSAVVLNFCSADETFSCVLSVQSASTRPDYVIVVDNDSPDDSLERLRLSRSGDSILSSGRNLGYGDGNNLGISHAVARGAELVWVLNPDVRVSPDCLASMLDLMQKNPDIGICGPLVTAGDVTVVDSRITPWLGYHVSHRFVDKDATLPQGPIPTDYVEGCCILLRVEMLREIGLFRDDFFMYAEEAELCLRAADAGWKVCYIPKALATTRPLETGRNRQAWYLARNTILLARVRRRYLVPTVLHHLAVAFLHTTRIRRQISDWSLVSTMSAIYAGFRHKLTESPRL
jgi:GT2 family glycosyltransferase